MRFATRRRSVCVRHVLAHQQEPVAAEARERVHRPRDAVVRTKRYLEALRDLEQQLVGRSLPEADRNVREVIEVDREDGGRPPVARCPNERRAHPVDEQTRGWEARSASRGATENASRSSASRWSVMSRHTTSAPSRVPSVSNNGSPSATILRSSTRLRDEQHLDTLHRLAPERHTSGASSALIGVPSGRSISPYSDDSSGRTPPGSRPHKTSMAWLIRMTRRCGSQTMTRSRI